MKKYSKIGLTAGFVVGIVMAGLFLLAFVDGFYNGNLKNIFSVILFPFAIIYIILIFSSEIIFKNPNCGMKVSTPSGCNVEIFISIVITVAIFSAVGYFIGHLVDNRKDVFLIK